MGGIAKKIFYKSLKMSTLGDKFFCTAKCVFSKISGEKRDIKSGIFQGYKVFSNLLSKSLKDLKSKLTCTANQSDRAMKDNTKKAEIVKAGSACFARFGFDKTTLDDIGRHAGLNKASLYYYFKNKEEIFNAVVLMETKAFIADLQAKALAFPDVRKQVKFFLTERIRRYGEVMHLTRLSVDNLHKLQSVFDEVYRETKASEVSFLTELLKKGVADNAFSFPEPSASVAESLFWLSDALKFEAVRPAGRLLTGAADFTGAIEKLERLLRLIMR